ncbi:MAG: type I restriction endonuclease, partial [Pseudolabrys sp.]
IVLFINGLPVCVVECKYPEETSADAMAEAIDQLQRYANLRSRTRGVTEKEGDERLFQFNQFMIATCGDGDNQFLRTLGLYCVHRRPHGGTSGQPVVHENDLLAGNCVVFSDKQRHQISDIGNPFPQWWQFQLEDTQPVVEIGTKAAIAYLFPDILVCRRQHLYIHLYFPVATEAPQAAVLDNLEQLGLQVNRHLADLIEKNRTAMRLFKQPATGKAAQLISINGPSARGPP